MVALPALAGVFPFRLAVLLRKLRFVGPARASTVSCPVTFIGLLMMMLPEAIRLRVPPKLEPPVPVVLMLPEDVRVELPARCVLGRMTMEVLSRSWLALLPAVRRTAPKVLLLPVN